MIRIRQQIFTPGQRRATVHIISVDQFTRFARRVDCTRTEREHLKQLLDHVLTGACITGECAHECAEPYTLRATDGAQCLFWLEKL